MSKTTGISWTDSTFNPWIGCTKVSAGCQHCYAEVRDQRFAEGKHWGKGAPRQRTSESNWKGPLNWNRKALQHQTEYDNRWDGTMRQSFKPGTLPDRPARPRVFCASLADWLDDEVPIEWLADLLKLIHDTPNLDWLLLTKRPENWRQRIFTVGELWAFRGRGPSEDSGLIVSWLNGIAPDNIWLGTTVENQEMAERRIPQLIQIPAKIRFLSCEPLLGPVELTGLEEGKIQWVIVGGESGQGCRPMAIPWAEHIGDQCWHSGAAFFMKQLGGERDKRHNIEDFPPNLQHREFPHVEAETPAEK